MPSVTMHDLIYISSFSRRFYPKNDLQIEAFKTNKRAMIHKCYDKSLLSTVHVARYFYYIINTKKAKRIEKPVLVFLKK